MSKFVILDSTNITKDDIKQICALEKKYYNLPVEEQFSVRKTTSLHKLNNDDLVVLKDTENNQVVGFISMIPVKWSCYNKIRSGKYLDTIINTNNVKVYEDAGFYNLYISSVIVDKEKHSYSALKYLIEGIFKKVWNLAMFKNVFIKNVLADTITKDGEKLCKMFGFKEIRKTTHNSTIYEIQTITNANYVDLFKHNAGERADSLIHLYKTFLEKSKVSYKIKKSSNRFFEWLKYIFTVRWKNKALIKKYPFLRYHPECTEGYTAIPYFERHPYEKTFLDEMPEGWRKAFGIQMCEDIKKRILEYDKKYHKDFLHEYSLSQVKEKWASLRWYDNGTPEGLDLNDIISHYEDLSELTCIICGKQPTKYATLGWINYICEDCKEHAIRDPEAVRKLTWNDIATSQRYNKETGEWTPIESDIDFKKYWEEPKEE